MAANDPGQPVPSIDATFTTNLDTPESALAIGAHPDDVEFGCGGLLAKWAADGCTIHHLICTDGSKGTWDPDADLVALAFRRQLEQREAAGRLGGAYAGDVRFLGYVDGELESSLVVRGEVAQTIRELKPEVVLGHDPWKRYRIHPDHRHAGFLACEGVVAARDPHFFKDQGLDHHRPKMILLWEADQPDHAEDVSSYVDVKLHALAAHESQFESTMKAVDDAQLDAFDQRISERLGDLGKPFDMKAAEIFKVIRDL